MCVVESMSVCAREQACLNEQGCESDHVSAFE